MYYKNVSNRYFMTKRFQNRSQGQVTKVYINTNIKGFIMPWFGNIFQGGGAPINPTLTKNIPKNRKMHIIKIVWMSQIVGQMYFK